MHSCHCSLSARSEPNPCVRLRFGYRMGTSSLRCLRHSTSSDAPRPHHMLLSRTTPSLSMAFSPTWRSRARNTESHWELRGWHLWVQTTLDNGEHHSVRYGMMWTLMHLVQEELVGKEITHIREICGYKGRVIRAVSSGVDSSVAAKLMHEAIGDRSVVCRRSAVIRLTSVQLPRHYGRQRRPSSR